jgi:hypothetical protein
MSKKIIIRKYCQVFIMAITALMLSCTNVSKTESKNHKIKQILLLGGEHDSLWIYSINDTIGISRYYAYQDDTSYWENLFFLKGKSWEPSERKEQKLNKDYNYFSKFPNAHELLHSYNEIVMADTTLQRYRGLHLNEFANEISLDHDLYALVYEDEIRNSHYLTIKNSAGSNVVEEINLNPKGDFLTGPAPFLLGEKSEHGIIRFGVIIFHMSGSRPRYIIRIYELSITGSFN